MLGKSQPVPALRRKMFLLSISSHFLSAIQSKSFRRYSCRRFILTTADMSLNEDFHLSSGTQNSVAASASFSWNMNKLPLSCGFYSSV